LLLEEQLLLLRGLGVWFLFGGKKFVLFDLPLEARGLTDVVEETLEQADQPL